MNARPAFALLTASAVTIALAACTTSASPTAAREEIAAAPAAAACTSGYEAGAWSMDMILQNQTGQTLTLDPNSTNRSGPGHWAQQPPTTIAPGGCAVINGYSDNPLGTFWVTGTFTLPDGTYVPFSCGNQAAFGDGPACNDDAFTTMPSGLDPDSLSLAPLSSVSTTWAVQVSSATGTIHLHWTLTAGPYPGK